MLLSALIFMPLLGAVFLFIGGRRMEPATIKHTALAVAAIDLALALMCVAQYDLTAGGYQFVEQIPWIAAVGIDYHVGMDGLSLLLVVLAAGLGVIAVACSFTAIDDRLPEYYGFLLALQTGIVGTFLALDLVLFYVFWEIMLIPLYFLIGMWGTGRRVYATLKFVLFTLTGSVVMLIGFLSLHYLVAKATGVSTFNVVELTKLAPQLGPDQQLWLFLSFFLAFAIKAPLFPFHTWLPDAHTEAPTAGSIVLAGVLLKTGVYGMLRFCVPFFPVASASMAPAICWLSVIAIVYGALTAMAQTDLKRLVAYSSVSHMGFIVLGIFAFNMESLQGSSLQMINHGISTGGLFLAVGILYERRHTRDMAQYGGIYSVMRNFGFLTIVIVLSSAGLPGLNGFVGEFLILLGAWGARFPGGAGYLFAILGASGVILGAVYLLIFTQRIFFGPVEVEENTRLAPLNGREKSMLVALVAFAFWIGLYPKPFLKYLEPASRQALEAVVAANPMPVAPAVVESGGALLRE